MKPLLLFMMMMLVFFSATAHAHDYMLIGNDGGISNSDEIVRTITYSQPIRNSNGYHSNGSNGSVKYWHPSTRTWEDDPQARQVLMRRETGIPVNYARMATVSSVFIPQRASAFRGPGLFGLQNGSQPRLYKMTAGPSRTTAWPGGGIESMLFGRSGGCNMGSRGFSGGGFGGGGG